MLPLWQSGLPCGRLEKKGVLALPCQEFYVILPPEHCARGCLPPPQFIPELMERFGNVYYVGQQSAAEFHGAAHHRPRGFATNAR